MSDTSYPKGLDNRMRDKNGAIRRKRKDTQVRTLRKEYGADFAKGYPPETTLGTVLMQENVASLSELLKQP